MKIMWRKILIIPFTRKEYYHYGLWQPFFQKNFTEKQQYTTTIYYWHTALHCLIQKYIYFIIKYHFIFLLISTVLQNDHEIVLCINKTTSLAYTNQKVLCDNKMLIYGQQNGVMPLMCRNSKTPVTRQHKPCGETAKPLWRDSWHMWRDS